MVREELLPNPVWCCAQCAANNIPELIAKEIALALGWGGVGWGEGWGGKLNLMCREELLPNLVWCCAQCVANNIPALITKESLCVTVRSQQA